jgi:hypothetical protein
VKFGISFTLTLYNQGGALVLVYRDGSVQVNHGGTEMGQGLYTKIRQIAAHHLAWLDSIRIMPTRTDKVPNTSASARLRQHRSERRGRSQCLRSDLRADETDRCDAAGLRSRRRPISRWCGFRQ